MAALTSSSQAPAHRRKYTVAFYDGVIDPNTGKILQSCIITPAGKDGVQHVLPITSSTTTSAVVAKVPPPRSLFASPSAISPRSRVHAADRAMSSMPVLHLDGNSPRAGPTPEPKTTTFAITPPRRRLVIASAHHPPPAATSTPALAPAPAPAPAAVPTAPSGSQTSTAKPPPPRRRRTTNKSSSPGRLRTRRKKRESENKTANASTTATDVKHTASGDNTHAPGTPDRPTKRQRVEPVTAGEESTTTTCANVHVQQPTTGAAGTVPTAAAGTTAVTTAAEPVDPQTAYARDMQELRKRVCTMDCDKSLDDADVFDLFYETLAQRVSADAIEGVVRQFGATFPWVRWVERASKLANSVISVALCRDAALDAVTAGVPREFAQSTILQGLSATSRYGRKDEFVRLLRFFREQQYSATPDLWQLHLSALDEPEDRASALADEYDLIAEAGKICGLTRSTARARVIVIESFRQHAPDMCRIVTDMWNECPTTYVGSRKPVLRHHQSPHKAVTHLRPMCPGSPSVSAVELSFPTTGGDHTSEGTGSNSSSSPGSGSGSGSDTDVDVDDADIGARAGVHVLASTQSLRSASDVTGSTACPPTPTLSPSLSQMMYTPLSGPSCSTAALMTATSSPMSGPLSPRPRTPMATPVTTAAAAAVAVGE